MTPSTLSLPEQLSLLSLFLASIAIVANTFHGDGEPLIASLAFSGMAFSATYAMIRWLGPTFMKAGLKGKDLSKVNKKEIPETMGAVCAVVYLLVAIVFIPFPFYKDILASYLSAILSLQSVVILGIGDDLFDIRWRHKFFIPAFASIPILIVYFVDFGVTHVVVPTPLRPYLGDLLNLGWAYYLYMAAIAIFAPNSINILAGINGIEVSQSLVIAFLLALNDILYLLPPSPPLHPATDSHLLSLYLLLPFIGVSLALWTQNRFPAKVFVGDTYCYFAGTVFAACAILGHFSKTLLLLLLPQIANFVYSAPQLFRLIACPRHRLPRFNARSGLLEPSVTLWTREPNQLQSLLISVLERVGCLGVTRDEDGKVTETTNMTILNLWLVWRGPLREDRLLNEIVCMQVLVGLAGLFVRHKAALLIFTADNL
ncbi:hypothetical protein GMDG_02577 [Pseudogymnoascus destructans 20631-21]|uniref:UDP-N-acetylglucosamine--dolichyl-phosphate N-acetylglucosaminephosphotransferase n=1 Tax=Pseudogymnoascus destructans (strain ATCC MYA-4855 / 20631-21) TaxID=658429 RepID=L8G2K0_PSED2|nr:hypothetical protein GMDG_02577 [Pseudogymnoascus destructans 20631-21]